jgi:hypothetical protein
MSAHIDRQLARSAGRTTYPETAFAPGIARPSTLAGRLLGEIANEITLIGPLKSVGVLLLLIWFSLAFPIATGPLFSWGPSRASQAYAVRMQEKADRAARELDFISHRQQIVLSMRTQVTGVPSNGLTFDAVTLLAHRSGDVARRLTDDFDVVPPPAGLERAHQQVIDALRQWITATSDGIFSASLRCRDAPRSDRCGMEWATSSTRRAQAQALYWRARNRTAALLREQRVTIADILDW